MLSVSDRSARRSFVAVLGPTAHARLRGEPATARSVEKGEDRSPQEPVSERELRLLAPREPEYEPAHPLLEGVYTFPWYGDTMKSWVGRGCGELIAIGAKGMGPQSLEVAKVGQKAVHAGCQGHGRRHPDRLAREIQHCHAVQRTRLPNECH